MNPLLITETMQPMANTRWLYEYTWHMADHPQNGLTCPLDAGAFPELSKAEAWEAMEKAKARDTLMVHFLQLWRIGGLPQ